MNDKLVSTNSPGSSSAKEKKRNETVPSAPDVDSRYPS